MKKQTTKYMDKKGISQFLQYAMGFGVGVVGFVIVIILLQSLVGTSSVSCTTSSYIYNSSTGLCNSPTNASATQAITAAGNVTTQGLVFSNNFSTQWGLSGTILGYTLVLAILALIGIGAYAGWNKVRGNR